MKFGARNNIVGEVVMIKKGDVMCQVDVKLKGTDFKMSSVMTVESLEGLELKKGDTVRVIAKAVNVLLARE